MILKKAQKIEEAIKNFRDASMDYGVASAVGNNYKQKSKYYTIMLEKQNELYEAIGEFMEEFKFTVGMINISKKQSETC